MCFCSAGASRQSSSSASSGVTLEQAKEYVRTARFSVTRRRWDGVKTNYYSPTGATYVNEEGKINTSFARSDFDQSVEKAMEVFEE